MVKISDFIDNRRLDRILGDRLGEFIPDGYTNLLQAINAAGRQTFEESWTGEEVSSRFEKGLSEEYSRSIDTARWASVGIEIETASQQELNNFYQGSDSPQLGDEEIEQINKAYADRFDLAKQHADRLKVVNQRFRHDLHAATAQAVYIDRNGKTVSIPAEYWATIDGERTLASGEIRPFDDFNRDFLRPVLVTEITKTVRSSDDAKPTYSNEYLQLLERAIVEFSITDTHQPAARELSAWFQTNHIAGQNVSKRLADAMATMVRRPEMRRGGWHRPDKLKEG